MVRGSLVGEGLAGEPHRRRPPGGDLVEVGGQVVEGGVVEVGGGRAAARGVDGRPHDRGRLVGRERQLTGRQVDHLALAPQAGEGEGRVLPRRQHHVQTLGGLPAQARDERRRLDGVVERLDVVEHQHQRPRLVAGDRLTDAPGVGLCPSGLVGAGVGSPGPGDRGHQVGRQARDTEAQRVGDGPHGHREAPVTWRQAVPRRHRQRGGGRPPAEERGLTEARTGDDAGETAAQRVVKARLEAGAGDGRWLPRAGS